MPAWVLEDVTVVRSAMVVRQVATARNIAEMRRRFAIWLAADLLPGDLLDDLVLVVYEALANVVDHAYVDVPDDVGYVGLTARRAHDSLRITVSDHGAWRGLSDRRFRGRGLDVIGVLIAQVYTESTGSGTRVHLRTVLPPPDASG